MKDHGNIPIRLRIKIANDVSMKAMHLEKKIGNQRMGGKYCNLRLQRNQILMHKLWTWRESCFVKKQIQISDIGQSSVNTIYV